MTATRDEAGSRGGPRDPRAKRPRAESPDSRTDRSRAEWPDQRPDRSRAGSPDLRAGRPRVGSPDPRAPTGARPDRAERPLYARVLRLRHTRLARWQAVLLFDMAIVVGVLLALAELATAWSPVVLPAAVAVVVKLYDVVAGMAGPPWPATPPPGCHRAVVGGDRRYVPRHAAPRHGRGG